MATKARQKALLPDHFKGQDAVAEIAELVSKHANVTIDREPFACAMNAYVAKFPKAVVGLAGREVAERVVEDMSQGSEFGEEVLDWLGGEIDSNLFA